jgi:hypothetical protein
MMIAEPDSSIPTCETVPERRFPDSLLPTIQEKLVDPKYSSSEVQHLVARELARLCLEIRIHGKDSKAGRILRSLRAQSRAVQALADSVRRIEAQRKNEDQSDFDGARFQYVLKELLECFNEAIRKTLGRDDPASAMTVKTARGILRQIWEKREPELRREVSRIR